MLILEIAAGIVLAVVILRVLSEPGAVGAIGILEAGGMVALVLVVLGFLAYVVLRNTGTL